MPNKNIQQNLRGHSAPSTHTHEGLISCLTFILVHFSRSLPSSLVQLTLDLGMLCSVSVLRLSIGMGCIYRRTRLPWIHPKMSIVRNLFFPATATSSRALDHLVVILLLGMNLSIWWNLQEDRTVADPTVSMAQERRGADPDMILPPMGHVAYIGGLLVPLLILLAFAMGHLLGKHRARSQMTTAPAPNLAWQEGMNTKAHVRTPRDHSNTNIGSTSPGTEETHGDNTEMRQDVHHFGKARIPSDTHAQTIVKELAQISFTDGKNRGRTFEEVWNNDHDNSYKNWLQKRLHDIDIVYPAFVVYAELMESLQRRPSWRVHQNQ